MDLPAKAREIREGSRLGLPEVMAGLDAVARLRVAVVGETIIDEYAYCDAIGKSGKEPMLVTQFLGCETQAGGALAIANHLADFCQGVELVTALGDVESRESFIRSALRSEIEPTFIYKANSPTIVKRRYIDAYSHAKMMGVYRMNTAPLVERDEEQFCANLREVLKRVDVAVVADYGHGLITRPAVRLLCNEASFLAVNTQLNAANHGFHTLSKYPRADYACMHEGELRLDARDLHGETENLLADAAGRLGAQALMATLGKRGTILHKGGECFRCPALAGEVVERVGAGDAVLALSSVAVAVGLHPELVGILGNLAGAQIVAVMGNESSIKKSTLVEQLQVMYGPESEVERG